MKIKTNSLSVKDIEEYANQIRKYFKIKENAYFPILEVLEELDSLNLLKLVIVNDDFFVDENVLACYELESKSIVVKESVINEYEAQEYRSAFTLAHEFFHFIQDSQGFSFEEVEDCPSYCELEWQANEFAGQLLVPLKFVDKYSIEELANMFHVSIDCATIRKLYKVRRENKKLKRENVSNSV